MQGQKQSLWWWIKALGFGLSSWTKPGCCPFGVTLVWGEVGSAVSVGLWGSQHQPVSLGVMGGDPSVEEWEKGDQRNEVRNSRDGLLGGGRLLNDGVMDALRLAGF